MVAELGRAAGAFVGGHQLAVDKEVGVRPCARGVDLRELLAAQAEDVRRRDRAGRAGEPS